MQVDISPKEFARYQNQLIELRNENYLATEARNKALKTVENLEVQLAKLSCELANTNANLTRIQNAGNITEIYKENDQLRHKLIGLESSFQLQSSTLRAEVTRLITEKEELLLKGLSPSDAFSRAQKQESQAIQFPSTSIQITNQMTQTDLSGNVVIHDEQEAVILRARLQELQSDLQAAHRDRELFSFRLEEANLELRSKEEHFSTKLIDYQQKQEEGQKELARLEQELAQAREIAESSRDAAESIRRRSENVKRDLKRQLANAIKNSGSLGPNRISRQNDDSESLCSLLSAGGAQRFSKLSAPECQSIHSCGSSDQELNGLPFGYRGKSDGPFPMNSERDKKSLIDSNVSNSIKEATRGLGQLAPSSIRSFDSDQILTNTLSEADFRVSKNILN
ncbi:unnamed protein product [Protopolystoma xenopodis]|uniref:Uncharacterized protein n=1 Tax=Protopolystoma xenopodis TaxID=117903 RepID=A0A3S4ZXX0_9PLAT|nr:unnamed protein product [Protopolystoma xenopodis]